MRFEQFEYMRWAKTIGQEGDFRLTNSGMPDLTQADLGIPAAELTFSTKGFDRPRDLTPLVARHYGVPEDCVFVTASASHANAMVLLALLEAGDDALVESPTYPALPLLAKFSGARVIDLPRPFESGFRVDPARVRSMITPKTRVVALTNLHNPSGVRIDDATLDAISAEAARVGATVYVDEVYLDLVRGARAAFSPGSNRVSVSSATKAWGLGGIRVGWALAAPEIVRKLVLLNDYFVVNPPWPSVRVACEIFQRESVLRDRMARVIGAGRAIVEEFLRRPEIARAIEWAPPAPESIIGFPRLRDADDASPFLDRLLRERRVNLTPGRFFGARGHFRMAFSQPETVVREALDRLGAALAAR